jgi:hypothetical protein
MKAVSMRATAGPREASFLCGAAADRPLDIKRLCLGFARLWANRVVDERIALFEEMYTRICGGEWTCRSQLQGIVPEMAQL